MPLTNQVSRDVIDEYLEKLLKLQFEASETISHKLTKGELREKFIVNMVHNEFPNVTLRNGVLSADNWQSSQADFLLLKDNSRAGMVPVYDVNDCILFMEIKSLAKKREFACLEMHAKEIKEKNTDLLVGIFCYSTIAKENTVLKQFGFKYDSHLMSYDAYNAKMDEYPHVDFIYSLNINNDGEPFFVISDINSNRTLYKQSPVIKYFFNMFKL